MSFLEYLRKRRGQLEGELARRGLSHTLSLARYRLHQHLSKAIEQHASGRCLDAGSGRSPYRVLLEEKCSEVVSIDIEDRSGEVDVIADLQDMPEIADESFDTVLCSQVLEHVSRPWLAISEMARVLRPGGVLILSVPHLSMIHEAPHDYFRFTEYGLAALCKSAQFEVDLIRPTGGLISFLSHGASVVAMSSLGSLPILRWPVWFANFLFLVIFSGFMDRLMGIWSVCPSDIVGVAIKPTKPTGTFG